MDKILEKLRTEKENLLQDLEENQEIIDVLYYGEIVISKNDAEKKNEKKIDLYLVKKQVDGKDVMELNTNGEKFAIIDKENRIIIQDKFKMLINEKEILLQLRNIMPMSLNKLEELKIQKANKARTKKVREPKNQSNEQDEKNEPRYIAEIDVNKKITPDKTIKELVPEVKQKNIKRVLIKRTSTTKMEFVGIDENEEEIQLESIAQTQGTNPKQDVVEVNKDGSSVSKNKVLSIMQIKGGANEQNQNEGFTIDIGQYGIPEVNYYRRAPETNEYTSVPVSLEDTNEKSTNLKVRNYIDKTKNSTVDDNIKRANDELKDKDKTVLENIDDDPYNDKESINILIQKAAKRCKVSYEAFMIEYEKASGETIEEKIDDAENTLNEQYRGGKAL